MDDNMDIAGWELDNKKYMHLSAMKLYHSKLDADIQAKLDNKQDKNLIVTYTSDNKTSVTHGCDEIADAADAGIEVKLFDGYEYLNLLEYSKNQGFAVFYVDYFDMNNVLTIKYVVVSSDGDVMMQDKQTKNVAYKEDITTVNKSITALNKLVGTIPVADQISSACTTVKDDLLNGAGAAYDTLKELGDLIDESHDAIDALEIVAAGKADAEHYHGMDSIEGLEEAVNAAADSKFYVVTFDQGSDGEYHADLTFAEIREKFEAGGNMVARIDGTDYIPLLSAAQHQIIFSGIYQATSVSLTISKDDVCVLSSTSLARSNHNHNTASSESSGFMSKADKSKLDGIETGAEVNVIESIVVNGEEVTVTDKTVNITIPEQTQGQSQVQSDWNQNDETASDYVKNRPFYDETVVVIDETTVTNGYKPNMLNTLGGTGAHVTVVYDGVSYDCVVKSVLVKQRTSGLNGGTAGVPYWTIGSQHYLNDDLNFFPASMESFLIAVNEGNGETTVYCGNGTHTISVTRDVVVQIDEKFIPDTIVTTPINDALKNSVADWNQNDESAPDYIKNRPFYDNTEVLLDTITVNNGDTLDIDFVNDIGDAGDTVTVIWDGSSFERDIDRCDVISGRWGILYYTLGNQSYLNDAENAFDDTGEGFLIKTIDGGDGTVTVNCDSNPHTLSIVKGSIVHIDEKFIPGTIARVSDVDAKIDDALASIPSASTVETKMPISLGAFQYFKWGNLPGNTIEEKAQHIARYDVIVYQGELSGNLTLSGTAYQNEFELYKKALEYNPNLKVFGYLTARGFAFTNGTSTTVGMTEYRTSPANVDHPIWTKEELCAYINIMAHCGGDRDLSAGNDEFGNPILTGGIPLYGVFFDDYDYNFENQNTHLQHQGDWNSIREKHNFLIDYAHSCGLHVMPNSNPNLIFDNTATPSNYRNPDGIESHMNENDWYCAESYFLRSDNTFGLNDHNLTDYNENYRDAYKSKCLALTYISSVADDSETNEQVASTFALYQALCQGAESIALHGSDLVTELPAELARYYDKNNNAVYSSGDGFYSVTVNGHTITASRSVAVTSYGMTPDADALATCKITIDGQHTFNNIYVNSDELVYDMANFKNEFIDKIDELSDKVEQTSNLYHRAFIDDWEKNYTLSDYTNHCFTFQNAYGGEDTNSTSSWSSLYPYNFTINLPSNGSWRRVEMDARHLAGKTVELGFGTCDAYLSGSTSTKLTNVVWQVMGVCDSNDWLQITTFNANSTNKSEIDGVVRCCTRFTVPSDIQKLAFWTHRLYSTPSGTWVVKVTDSYLVDVSEYTVRKTWFTNYAPPMSNWGIMGSWRNYTLSRNGDRVTTTYTAKNDCYESGLTFPANADIFKPGETWEIGFKDIKMTYEDGHGEISSKIIIMLNIGTSICPDLYLYGKTYSDFKNMKSATGDDNLIAITRFTIPNTYSGGMPQTPMYIWPANYVGGDNWGMYSLSVEGLYMYKIDEKDELAIRGEEPSDTYIGINRVRSDTIDDKLQPDTIYVVDDGSMFITNFRGERVNLHAQTKMLNNVDLDDMFENGLYSYDVDSGITNSPRNVKSILRVENYPDASYCKHTVTLIDGLNTEITREFYNGAWGTWDFINPPMWNDTEYRTTERYNGKAVYKKLVYCGHLPSSSSKSVDTGISKSGFKCIAANLSRVFASDNGCISNDPAIACKVVAGTTNFQVSLTTTSDLSADTATVEIKYIKV